MIKDSPNFSVYRISLVWIVISACRQNGAFVPSHYHSLIPLETPPSPPSATLEYWGLHGAVVRQSTGAAVGTAYLIPSYTSRSILRAVAPQNPQPLVLVICIPIISLVQTFR